MCVVIMYAGALYPLQYSTVTDCSRVNAVVYIAPCLVLFNDGKLHEHLERLRYREASMNRGVDALEERQAVDEA